MKDNAIQGFIEELRKAPKVALFSHVSPDGDCIGSMLAIGLALEKIGKEVQFYNQDPMPKNLSFLSGASRLRPHANELLPDTILFVDCADIRRAGVSLPLLEGKVLLNLDHHVSNQLFGAYNWVDVEASATGEIARTLILSLGIEIDLDIATNLYTAIVTDTGSFQYSNTTAKTHRIAAELLEAGIDLLNIHNRLFDQKPMAQIKLLTRALNSLELYANGMLGVISLSRKDFRESLAEDCLSEGLINHARSIEGVEVAVLIREVDSGGVKIGFRSNVWFDVNKTASKFGGGGHMRASGCSLDLSMQEAKIKIVSAIVEDLKFGRSS
ncbi:MAG: bifunctional oligoribonuclease/PAP phosphatase NrnA [Desulfitobacterium hafniense]|nr:bifunctional oligoribonuclease/PAP phosphatase NrnA [Desulfitobacterium hafniense]